MPKYNFSRDELYEFYVVQQMNPYEISKVVGCNHKTIRSHLRKHAIPLRTASEYNYLGKKTHVNPSADLLMTAASIAGHVAYLCEGWHTDKSSQVHFCNQDPVLIDLVVRLLRDTYSYHKEPRIVVCGPDPESAKSFLALYPNARFVVDRSRKNPIIRVLAGGKMLVRDLVSNCYRVLETLTS